MIRRALFGASLLIAGAAEAAPETPTPVAYTNVTLIDGNGTAPRAKMAIVVDGERIAEIVPAAKAPPGAKDMHGAFAIPGLIDTHVHLATWPNRPYAESLLRRDVYAGITAVRDMAGDTRELGYLAREARTGAISGPDVYYAALMAGPDFFKDPRTAASTQGGFAPGAAPWMRAVTQATDLKLAVAEAKGTGATAIKIYADLPAPTVAAITAEAHRQHLLVWAHAAVFPASPLDVANAGVDAMSHVCMLGYQAQAMPGAYHDRAPVDASKLSDAALAPLFAALKARQTVLDATLYVYQTLDKMKDANPPPYCTLALASKILAQAYRAGIAISAGTDADSDWHEPFPALPDEMALLVKAGMTPMDAIRAATAVAARTIGRQNEMGTLETGKLANIAFVARDPLADIANIRSVTLTVKRGKEFARADYKPITQDEAKDAGE